MFLTRSIRRKMGTGLSLVIVMLMMLSLSGVSLRSYRTVVDDLDYSINQAPRRSDLVAAISPLFEPLLLHPLETPEAIQFQQQEVQKRLQYARAEFQTFHRKLEQMPQSPDVVARQPVANAILADINRRLDRLEQLQTGLHEPEHREQVSREMLEQVAFLQTLAQRVPDPRERLSGTLTKARRFYRSRVPLFNWLSAMVVVMFLVLTWFGYRGVIVPIRKLYQGTRRVGQGDLNYRLDIATQDEMGELATAFNQMTARFQEIKEDLDRQVSDRSKQLVRSERLAGVGFLAAGVAHEINNPLSAIMMATDSLQERFHGDSIPTADDAEVARDYLEMIQTEATRCKTITAKLLDFSRGQDATRSRHDVTSIIHEVLSLISHMSKFRDRTIEFDHTASCYLEINGPEIKQVVLNLVANALECMEGGGLLRIEIIEQTDNVILTFQDDGCGMPQDVIEHLFDPFFTKKKSGKGTGLGLSISHRIIHDHGGTIEAQSDGEGQGSLFLVRLPRKAVIPEAA